MQIISSKDQTKIAYDVSGHGAAIILVNGALTTRTSAFKDELAALLGNEFTIYAYDRRGRGDSGDTLPYSVEREIEDIEVLIATAGGAAYLCGHSSGAALAMEAALALGDKVRRLVMYEAPYNDDELAQKAWKQYRTDISASLSNGEKDGALAAFMAYVGTPPEQIEGMRQGPYWAQTVALAPTLAYDAEVLGEYNSVPVSQASRNAIPTMVMYGESSFPFMSETAKKLVGAMPHAELLELKGQTHDPDPGVFADSLRAFLNS